MVDLQHVWSLLATGIILDDLAGIAILGTGDEQFVYLGSGAPLLLYIMTIITSSGLLELTNGTT
jgi:hypothetical protein